jgi:glycosyltransferase involved in cell wall biosynthesis
MDQLEARTAGGASSHATIILYVGGIDEYHDLEPVIDALGEWKNDAVELHVVGNGEYRAAAEARAASAGVAARFHGHVPHELVPHYIATSDLCIAPYRLSAFHDNVLTFSTLKIPEYMACARPVVSVPSPPIARLIADGRNGFIFPNEARVWRSFLERMPSRDRLMAMGRAAADAAASITWDATARGYLQACEDLVAARTPA